MIETIHQMIIFLHPIPGYERYEICKEGLVYDTLKERFISICDKDGYKVFNINIGGNKRKLLRISRTLAQVFILNPDNRKCVDHINRDRSDDRIENLRWVTVSQNAMNQSIQSNNKSSQYKGVTFNKLNKKWQSYIKYNRKSIHIGLFTSEIEAAEAYDKRAIELFGKYACLNYSQINLID